MRVSVEDYKRSIASGKFDPSIIDSLVTQAAGHKEVPKERKGKDASRRSDFPRRTIKLRLPWPPSANRIWRRGSGKTFLSPKYKEFKKEVTSIVLARQRKSRIKPIRVLNQNVLMTGKLRVEIVLHPPTRRNRDVDNCIKPILDALTSAGVFYDDADVWQVTATRGDIAPNGNAFVVISQFPSK